MTDTKLNSLVLVEAPIVSTPDYVYGEKSGASVKAAPAAGGSLTVTDGSTTIASTTEISFSGATVSSGGAGVADVAVSGGTLQSATVTLTSAQIKSLSVTPITIVSAPASGHCINVVSGFLSYRFGTMAYAGGDGTIGIYSGNLGDTGDAVNGLKQQTLVDIFESTADEALSFAPAAAQSFANWALFAPLNTPIWVGAVSDLTTGDGTLKIVIYYTVEAL